MTTKDDTKTAKAQCATCEGTGIGYGKVPGGWMETDCSDCDGTGIATP